MTLVVRISLLVALFFVLGSAVLGWRIIADGQERLREETASSGELIARLLAFSTENPPADGNRLDAPGFLDRMLALDSLRHIDVQVVSGNRDYPQFNRPPEIDAPEWFRQFMTSDMSPQVRSLSLPGGGEIRIIPDPGDEIDEIWHNLQTILATASILFLFFLATMYILVNYWMKQVNALTEVMNEAERGDFSRRVPKIALEEFNEIGKKVNHLTAVLGTRTTENERLTRKALRIQEQESRRLAQELHDSIGQSVSAMKAMAASIEERTRERDAVSAESARNIQQVANESYLSVRNLMSWLRPSVLDELGLVPALRQMVDEWNASHEDSFCRLQIEGRFDDLHEDQRINVYRIVQESLTNISRHAGAENVEVALSGREVVTLLIRDDGVGFDPSKVVKGMGLMGLEDRAQVLKGELSFSARPRRGVTIQIEFPRVSRQRRRRASDGR